MTESEAMEDQEQTPPYMIFLVVFLFFITGLLGFLICHLLKKKGYRCRTGDLDDDEEHEKVGGIADEDDEENQDTVEQILKCIIENEANMEAFNEMLGNNVCVRHDPRLRKESIGGLPPHHHTVHSGMEHNSCHLCAQIQSKKGRRQSKTPRFKQRPGEQTVFSVGRFRVIHTDKKIPGGSNPGVTSGDQVDQDSEEQKDDAYNLRSMFKDVRTPSESATGVASNVGKRRKSVTLFGLRRSSDTGVVKGLGEKGWEDGIGRFAIQKQPAVLEEEKEIVVVSPERGNTKAGSTPETQLSQNETPVTERSDPASQSEKQPQDYTAAPELSLNLPKKPSVETSAALSLLLSSSPTMSGHTSLVTEKLKEDKAQRIEQEFDLGPVQTSTPIMPSTGSFIPAGQGELLSSTRSAVIHSLPYPSSSPDLGQGMDATLALISLGSSPQSPCPIKTPSLTSLLKTPTSSQAVTSSPTQGPVHAPPSLSPKLVPGKQLSSLSSIPSENISPSEAQAASPQV